MVESWWSKVKAKTVVAIDNTKKFTEEAKAKTKEYTKIAAEKIVKELEDSETPA